MKKLNVFLLFPETDDEIIALGDQAENYEQISKNLNLFKNCINNKVEYHLFYDSDNLQSFKNKANELGKELSNCINNVRVLLGNKTTNISKNIIAKSDCVYYCWSIAQPCTNYLSQNIIKAAAEKSTKDDEEESTIIVSFLYTDQHERDIMPIIKDGKHYQELPILCKVPYFNPIGSAIEWINYVNDNRQFSLFDVSRFERTNYIYRRNGSKQRIFKEIETNNYWYYDFFHKDNKEHYEVYDNQGDHIYEADINGNRIENTHSKTKSIKKYLHIQ